MIIVNNFTRLGRSQIPFPTFQIYDPTDNAILRSSDVPMLSINSGNVINIS